MAATAQPPQFSCHAKPIEAGVVLVLRGELDLAVAETFVSRVDEAFGANGHRLVVDLRALTYLDSTGLHCLLGLAERARRSDVELALVPGPKSVMRLFEITHTLDVLPFETAA
jgi:anti-sigma B factor antagonist